MGQRLSLGWVFVATVALAGCSTQSSTIQLRSPEGSSLTFRNAEGGDLARVSFPGEVTLPQLAEPGSEPTLTLAGSLRVNDLVEAAAIPSKARSYLREAEGGVDVRVSGLYQIYDYPATDIDLLIKHDVDIDRAQLLELLSGRPVEVTGSTKAGKPVYRLVLGLGD